MHMVVQILRDFLNMHFTLLQVSVACEPWKIIIAAQRFQGRAKQNLKFYTTIIHNTIDYFIVRKP